MKFTDEKIEIYCEQHSSLPSDLCQEVGRYTKENHPLGRMVCGELVSSFLMFLIKSHNVQNVLELGTFTGYSALAMAEALPENGRITTIDKNKKINSYASENWHKSPHGKKIKALFGNGLDVLETLDSRYDLIFIDADKKNYLNYLNKCLNLLSDKGMIIVDNVLWSGKVTSDDHDDETTQALKHFNTAIKERSDIFATLLPIRDGLFLITKTE